ncbi:hypothetical protein ACFC6L_13585 [Kitasatospora phosalacinea]|uniref:hypothetical protein n=1 Tax=Kitasatospora phosalacinea TaxID=2065 RepID=UPI0035D6469C
MGLTEGPRQGRGRSRSPLIRRPGEHRPAPPPAHTDAELARLVALVAGARPPVETVAVGHGRDEASRAAAHAFAEAWQPAHGTVLAVVDWPEDAASWLRPARRLTTGAPDAWVVTGAAQGWAQLSRRLRHSTDWRPDRTFAFAPLGNPAVVELAGPDTLDGLRGASADGGSWYVDSGLVVHHGVEGLR